MSSRKIQIYASPGWEVEVDPEWAEGLFAVFLRHAKEKQRRKGGASSRKRQREADDTEVIVVKVAEEALPRGHAGAADDTTKMPVQAGREVAADEAPSHLGATPGEAPVERAEPVESTSPPSQTEKDVAEADEMPAVALSDFLMEMATLVKYGHADQVAGEVRRVFRLYPGDLLLRRRIIDFLVERGLLALATEELYGLGTKLFDGGDVEGVREVVSRVLELEPGSPKARRLLRLISEKQPTASRRS